LRRLSAALAAAALLLPHPSPGAAKARVFRVNAGGETVRVVVPKLFEPLLPGSVYPDRRRPRAGRATPVAIVERTLARRAEPLLLEHGFVVAEAGTIDRAAIDRILAALAARIDGGIGEATLLARSPGDALADPRVRAAALMDPPPDRGFPPASGGVPILLLRATAAGAVPAAATAPDGGVNERWYRSDRGLPPEAFRDAAEWLASAAAGAGGGRPSPAR